LEVGGMEKIEWVKKCVECGQRERYCIKCNVYHHLSSFKEEHIEYVEAIRTGKVKSSCWIWDLWTEERG
jgi:Zn ribbon nucleic-acid-binding protein